ncbi:MAG: DUF72 domain-containing protein [Sedimentisphaerales bacterium]|nr:DUF72 domain-containing protein [Sedimentisphaerales bacterium]
MRKTNCVIRIGTSGWYYDHWKEVFYPTGLAKSKWFEHYAQHFDTVEVNNTFYHLPKEQTLQRWYEIAPKDFLYAVKANRFITHIKKLKDVSEPLERFFERVNLLKARLGPILYQLPPSLHKDLDRLVSFIQLLPKTKTAVFEFRHKSWYEDDTFELMSKLGVGFCIHDMPGKESPRIVTGDIIYVRFHGTTGRYAGNYPKSALQNWADWLKDQSKKSRAIYAYFNNDIDGHAIKNAKQLKGQFL